MHINRHYCKYARISLKASFHPLSLGRCELAATGQIQYMQNKDNRHNQNTDMGRNNYSANLSSTVRLFYSELSVQFKFSAKRRFFLLKTQKKI